MILINFLEFVAAKSKSNLTFVQLFIWFVLTKNRNYIIYMFQNIKLTQYLEQKQGYP